MKLITETSFEPVTSIVLHEDQSSDKKSLFIEGIFLQGDVTNRNGRIYPINILEGAVKEYDRKYIQTKRSMGELNHPQSPVVNPERASHIITELKRDGSNFIGRAKILSTPVGNIVRSLIEDGVNIGVSSRGMGSVKKINEDNVVQNDFMMSAIDIVSDPSAPEAFVNGIMEGKEWIWDNGAVRESKIAEMKDIIEEESAKIQNSQSMALTKIKLFNAFFNSLKN